MSLFTDKSVEIEVIDNGWVLSWKDETKERESWAGSTLTKPKTRGREVFTSKKKLLERISSLI